MEKIFEKLFINPLTNFQKCDIIIVQKGNLLNKFKERYTV